MRYNTTMVTYLYNISSDLYGGFFSANTSTILSLLSSKLIPNATLINIEANAGIMSVEYNRELTTEEKIILDNNQTNPCGGIIGRSNDYIQMHYPTLPEGVILETAAELAEEPYPEPEAFTDLLYIPSNGFSVCPLHFHYIRGDGIHTSGYGNKIEVIPDGGSCTMTSDSGTLDANGEFQIQLGPTYNKGRYIFRVWTSFLPIISFAIRFSDEVNVI